MLAADRAANELSFAGTPQQPLLVSQSDPVFAHIPKDWLVTSVTQPYTDAFVALLADELSSSRIWRLPAVFRPGNR